MLHTVTVSSKGAAMPQNCMRYGAIKSSVDISYKLNISKSHRRGGGGGWRGGTSDVVHKKW